MSLTATFTNPYETYDSSGTSATVPVANYRKEAALGQDDTLTLLIRSDVVSKYSLESDAANNPLMMNSRVVLADGAKRIFEGFVAKKPYYDNAGEGHYLVVLCLDKGAALGPALCPDDSGRSVWVVTSDTITLVNMPMQESEAWGSSSDSKMYTIWPDPNDSDDNSVSGDDCYIKGENGDAAADTLKTGFLAGDTVTEIELDTPGLGFQARGFVKIDSEWFYYDGYDHVSAKLLNVTRAELGTTAADHAVGANVYERIAKQISVEAAVEITNTGGTLDPKTYYALPEDGCFASSQSFGTNPEGDYGIYDEDESLGGTVKDLADVFNTIVTAPDEYGGANFQAGDIEIRKAGAAVSTLGLPVNRVDYSPARFSEYAGRTLDMILAAASLQNEIVRYYDHTNNKYVLEQLYQKATPDITLDKVSEVERDLTVDDLVNGILLRYESEVRGNALKSSYMWHDTASNEGLDSWKYKSNCNPYWDGGGASEYTGADNTGMNLMIDGKLESKFWGKKTGASTGFSLYFWFRSGTTPATDKVDYIKAVFGNYSDRGGDETWDVRIEGCDDFNTSTHQSASGNWKLMGAKAYGKFTTQGKTNALATIEMQSDEITTKNVNCIRIRFLSLPAFNNDYEGIVHEFEVSTGSSDQYVLVQTDDTTDNGGTLLLAANSHKKIRGANANKPARCAMLDIGPASEGAAITLGRLELMNRLKWYQARSYQYEGPITTYPELGMTIAIDEDNDGSADYTGICRGYSVECAEGRTVITLTLLDYNAGDVA